MTGSITLGRVTITSSGYDPESKEPTVDPALARATGATQAERDAAVMEAVRTPAIVRARRMMSERSQGGAKLEVMQRGTRGVAASMLAITPEAVSEVGMSLKYARIAARSSASHRRRKENNHVV